jgi:hypothetical protein
VLSGLARRTVGERAARALLARLRAAWLCVSRCARVPALGEAQGPAGGER